MLPRRADLVGDVGAENVRLNSRAIGLQRELDEPRVGHGVLAEGDDTRASAAGGRRQPLEMRIVAVDYGGAACLEPAEDLGLGVGDRLDRAEELQMHRL